VKLLRPIDLGTSPNWELGVFEVSRSSPPLEYLKTVDATPYADHTMIYCNLISQQFVGDITVRCMQTFPAANYRHHEFRKVQYVPVEQRQCQSIQVVPDARGAALPIRGQHDAHKSGASFPQELPVVIFVIIHCGSIPPNTFIVIHPLELYYLNQAGNGPTHSGKLHCLCSPALPTAWKRHRQFFSGFSFDGSDHYCGSGPKM